MLMAMEVLAVALSLTLGGDYRQSFYKNVPFILAWAGPCHLHLSIQRTGPGNRCCPPHGRMQRAVLPSCCCSACARVSNERTNQPSFIRIKLQGEGLGGSSNGSPIQI